MSKLKKIVKPLSAILWPLVIVIIIADQLSKAYFVWLLGIHKHTSMMSFLTDYFTVWGDNDKGAIIANFSTEGFYQAKIWVVEPWLAWTLTTNTGAAWSLFAGNSFYLSFVSLAMATLLFLVWWFKFRYHRAMTWAIGAIIGGALGNFLDRFRLREVVDFIDVQIPFIGRPWGTNYDFPIFNIADSCAVCGTLALAAFLIFADIRALKSKREKTPDFKPLDEGLRLDEEAVSNLKKMAGERKAIPGTSLTIHVSKRK